MNMNKQPEKEKSEILNSIDIHEKELLEHSKTEKIYFSKNWTKGLV